MCWATSGANNADGSLKSIYFEPLVASVSALGLASPQACELSGSFAWLAGWGGRATQSWSPSPSAAMKTVAAIIVAESSCAHPKALVAATPVAAPMCTCNSKRPSKALAPPFASVPFVFEYHSFIHASILLMELAHMFTQHLSRLAGCMRAGFQAHGSVASHRLAEKRIPWAARPADRGTPLKAHLLPTGRA